MRNYSFSTTKERERAKKLYESGLSYYQIGQKIDRDAGSIRNWAQWEDWPPNIPVIKNEKKIRYALGLLKKGKPIKEIMAKTKLSRETLRRYGIKKRFISS